MVRLNIKTLVLNVFFYNLSLVFLGISESKDYPESQ